MEKKALAIWVAAVAVRLVLAFGFGRVEHGWTETQFIARSILESSEFGNPYAIPTGPTSHAGPVYPAIQALIFACFGYGEEAERARIVMSIGLAGLEYALLPWVGLRLGFGGRPGLAAGWFGALAPLHYWGEAMGVFENTLAALMLLVFTAWVARDESLGWRKASAAGAFAGLMLLTSPSLLLAIAAVAVWSAWRKPGALAAGAAAALLVLSPWLVRNRLVFGGWSFVRGELGLELNISNFDGASPDSMENVGSAHFQSMHPFASREKCLRIREIGERRFYSESLRQAASWIRGHQVEFARLAARRWLRFWVPWSQYGWHRAGLAAVLALAVLGWAAGGRRALPLFLVPAACSITALLIHTSIRYSHPAWWALCLAAGVAAKWLRDRLIVSP